MTFFINFMLFSMLSLICGAAGGIMIWTIGLRQWLGIIGKGAER